MRDRYSKHVQVKDKVYTSPVVLFLSVTLILTLARAMALPYLVLYCSERFAMGVADVGLALGTALIASTILSLYGGFLIDKFSNYWVLLIAGGSFTFALGTAFQTYSPITFFCAIVIVNLAYAVIDIGIKSEISTLITSEKRGEVFSVKYTLTNIGFAIGPFLGALLAQERPGLPFAVAGIIGALFVVIYGLLGGRGSAVIFESTKSNEFVAILGHLGRDTRLVCFTIGGLFSAIIFGQFSAYLSQYLLLTVTAEQTYQTINYLVTTNACVVISIQYFVGSRLNHANLFRMLCLGMLFFLLGLLGFSQADGMPMWIFAMIVFTIGETIIIPVEYLFIDSIAPENLRGVYYGAQNLSNLGGALGPILCGAALALFQPQAMFYILCLCVLLAVAFYYVGYKYRGNRHDSL